MITISSPLLFVYLLTASGLLLASVDRARLLALIPCGALLVLGYVQGYLAIGPLLVLSLLMVLIHFYVAEHTAVSLRELARKRVLYLGIVPLALLIAFRIFPGVNNPLLVDEVQLSAMSQSFSLYLSFDKGVLAILLWMAATYKRVPAIVSLQRAVWLLPLMLLVIFSLGISVGYVAFDLKWPGWSLLLAWGLGNLLVTCVVEEAFFRGIVQRGLMVRWQHQQYGHIAVLLFTSLLFGLAHFGGGWSFVLMATVAGLFYGLGYWLTGRLWFAVLLHFVVNLVHFVGFSYPALM